MSRWVVREQGDVVIIPLDDLLEHREYGTECWCAPTVTHQSYDCCGHNKIAVRRIITHEAADGRP